MLLKYFKQGFYHTFLLGVTSAFSRLLLFFFLPYILSKLTLAEFGIWDFYQHFYSLATMMLSSGAVIALTRFYILYKEEPRKQKQVIGNACISVLVLVGALFIVSPCLLHIFHAYTRGVRYFFVTVALTCLYSFFSLVLAYLRVREQLWRYAFILIVQGFLAAILAVLGLKYMLGIEAFFYAQGLSLLIFLPFFIKLSIQHWSFSWDLLKQQVQYSAPLLLYNFIFMGFFTLDRLFLKSVFGYEQLGVYALLWRFGGLYQFFSLSLINAAPILIFNAEKEKNNQALLQKLLTYAFLIIIVGGFISIYASHYALRWWFSNEYYTARYIPLFFMFLCTLDIARFMQTGFHLATKTVYIPILSFLALLVQVVLLWFAKGYGIAGICYANTGTFFLYAIASCFIAYKVYPNHIIDYKRTALLVGAFFVTAPCIFYCNIVALFLGWICFIWFFVFSSDEKQWLKAYLKRNNPSEAPRETTIVYDHEYSNAVTQKRIALVGPYPPPLGGISVHIKRVGEKLKKQQNDVFFFDTSQRSPHILLHGIRFFSFLIKGRMDIVYYHTPYSRWGIYELVFLVFLQKRTSCACVVVEHDKDYVLGYSWLSKKIFSWCMRRVASVVFIGNTPYQAYKQHALLPKKYTIESAFLPPMLDDEQAIVATYPQELFTFVATHSPLILANAFQLRLLNGVDVYGYDMCLELIVRLKEQYPQVGLLFALAQIGNEDYYQHKERDVHNLALAGHLFILQGQKELWPLYTYADIFVRPTVLDNYGISVAEALFFGVPALASNVCVRPEGSILFEPRNMDDFYSKVITVLQAGNQKKEEIKRVSKKIYVYKETR